MIIGLCRSSCCYQAKPKNDGEIRLRLGELAEKRRKFGSPRFHIRQLFVVDSCWGSEKNFLHTLVLQLLTLGFEVLNHIPKVSPDGKLADHFI